MPLLDRNDPNVKQRLARLAERGFAGPQADHLTHVESLDRAEADVDVQSAAQNQWTQKQRALATSLNSGGTLGGSSPAPAPAAAAAPVATAAPPAWPMPAPAAAQPAAGAGWTDINATGPLGGNLGSRLPPAAKTALAAMRRPSGGLY